MDTLTDELVDLLLAEGGGDTPLQALLARFCEALKRHGLPVCRASLGLETLHPEDSGSLLVWHDGTLERRDTKRAGILTSPSYLASPTRVVDETERPFRWRAGEDVRGMPLIEEMRKDGVADYLMLPLPFLDRTRSATMSFATRAPGGFDAAATAALERAARLLSPYAERRVLRRIAQDLLAAYLGPSAGARVYDGRIERGDVEAITAAILFADLRGFTALADHTPRRQVVAVLNRWFDVLGAAIETQGGDILKLMGDGLFAVFPAEGAPGPVCARALAAAEAAVAGTAGLGPWLAGQGLPPLRCGIGLHIGVVELGNIGTARRLDFTVIGPAVNQASRLETLTKTTGSAIAVSAELAAHVDRPLRRLGAFALRGIEEPVEVLAPEIGAD